MIYSHSFYKYTEGDHVKYDRRRDWYWAYQEEGPMFSRHRKGLYVRMGHRWWKHRWQPSQWRCHTNQNHLGWRRGMTLHRHHMRNNEPQQKKVYI